MISRCIPCCLTHTRILHFIDTNRTFNHNIGVNALRSERIFRTFRRSWPKPSRPAGNEGPSSSLFVPIIDTPTALGWPNLNVSMAAVPICEVRYPAIRTTMSLPGRTLPLLVSCDVTFMSYCMLKTFELLEQYHSVRCVQF